MKIVVDWIRREIYHAGGSRSRLSARETALLACLVRKAGTPVSRDDLLSEVWKLDPKRTATRTIDMHISFLRRKLAEDAGKPSVLITIHGVGYMLYAGVIPHVNVHRSTIDESFCPPAVTSDDKSLSVV